MASTSAPQALEYRIDDDIVPIELAGDILVPSATNIRDYGKRVYVQYTRILAYLKEKNIRMYDGEIPMGFSTVVVANSNQDRINERYGELRDVMTAMAAITADVIMREVEAPRERRGLPTEEGNELEEEPEEEEEGPDETPSQNKGKAKPQGHRTGGGGPPPDDNPSDDGDNPFTPRQFRPPQGPGQGGKTPSRRGINIKYPPPEVYEGEVRQMALQFVTHCHSYFRMKSVDFPASNHGIRIYFALGYIGGKAGEWAQRETETLSTAEYTGNYPTQLTTWDNFQEYFLLTWMDITTKDKARRSFFTGEIKQTQTARAYREFFKKRVLEADYPDQRMVRDAFFWGLKDSVRESLVTHPEFRAVKNLDMLITLATILDEVKNNMASKSQKTED
jgi:hypothetical protein